MGFLRRLPAVIVHNVRFWLSGPVASDRPLLPPMEPDGPHVQPLISHTHLWDRCRWNGQYWYARCIRYEWCTARIAC